MRIRAAQLEAFRRAGEQEYVDRILPYLYEDLPDDCRALGPAEVLRLAQAGIERAARHRVSSECNVYCFIRLMIALGEAFDEDEALPWAAHALAANVDEDEKTERLCELATGAFERARRQ